MTKIEIYKMFANAFNIPPNVMNKDNKYQGGARNYWFDYCVDGSGLELFNYLLNAVSHRQQDKVHYISTNRKEN